MNEQEKIQATADAVTANIFEVALGAVLIVGGAHALGFSGIALLAAALGVIYILCRLIAAAFRGFEGLTETSPRVAQIIANLATWTALGFGLVVFTYIRYGHL
jgi:uncharacterized membrane protein YtjA (UPF0391 family)